MHPWKLPGSQGMEPQGRPPGPPVPRPGRTSCGERAAEGGGPYGAFFDRTPCRGGPCPLFHVSPIEEGHNLAPGAGVTGGEGGGGLARGHTLFHGPVHGVREVGPVPLAPLRFPHVLEAGLGGGRGAAEGRPDKVDRGYPGAGIVGVEGAGVLHAQLRRPLDGLVVVRAGVGHVHVLGFRQLGLR